MQNTNNFSNPQGGMTPPPVTQGGGDNKFMAILSYFFILWIIPLMTDAKNNPFVKFHIKQGIILSIAGVVVMFVGGLIPVIGWVLSPLLSLVLFVLFIMGIINASSGEKKYLPVIGSLADSLLKF